MSEKRYGLIVIGGGITGLSAALAWTKVMESGRGQVVVFEKNKTLGGCVSTFARKGYRFDTTQLIPESSELFEFFGIDIPLVKFDGYFARIFLVNSKDGNAREFRIPSGRDEFKNMLVRDFPDEKKSISNFFKATEKVFNQLKFLKLEPDFLQLISILFKCRTLIRYSSYTFKDFIHSFGIENKDLLDIFHVFCAFSGMSAERCSALLTISAMQTSLAGCYRPEKAFITLPYAFKKQIQKNGGYVQTNTCVSRIIIKKGEAIGVELDNGEKIFSDYVITTVDTKVAMKNLVGVDVLGKLDSKYAEKVKKIKMSVSAFTVSLGLDDEIDLEAHGLKCGYSVLTTGNDTFESLFKAFDQGILDFRDDKFHCAVICPSIFTHGKACLIIRIVPVPPSDWITLRKTNHELYTAKKNFVADFYISMVEKYMIPDLKQHIIFKDIATPATFSRYLGSPTGSNYDMAPYVHNFGRKRLAMRTPVKNLFQPKFSHGIWPSMQAGLQVIDMIGEGAIMDGASRYSGLKNGRIII